MTILGQSLVIVRRYETGENVDGHYEAGPCVELAVMMSVQPANGRDIQLLPEGWRAREVLVGLTTATLRTVDGQGPPDVVVIDGLEYVAHSLSHTRSVIPHRSLALVRKDEVTP